MIHEDGDLLASSNYCVLIHVILNLVPTYVYINSDVINVTFQDQIRSTNYYRTCNIVTRIRISS